MLRITELSSPTKKELLTSSIDIVALLGHAASEISLLRWEQMKPALKPEFHALCPSETKASAKFLFGEDLTKQVRDVKETHRIGNTVGSSNGHSRGYRHDSWSAKRESHNKSGSHSRPPFWGKGTRPNSRKKSTLSEERQPCREEIMHSLEQIKLSVSDFPSFIAFSLCGYLQAHCDNFRAGCFSHSLTPGVG